MTFDSPAKGEPRVQALGMSETVRRLILLALAATALVPLLVGSQLFIYPFVAPKIYFFRILIGISLCLWGLLLLLEKRSMNWSSCLPLPVYLLTVSWIVGAQAALDPVRSVWDSAERMLGGVQLVHYVAFFVLLRLVVGNRKREWLWLQRCWVTGAAAGVLSGVLESLGLRFWSETGHVRVSGTLGQPIYYGGLALFVLFAALILAETESRRVLKGTWWGVSILGLFGVFISATRSSLIALAVSAGFLACLALFRSAGPLGLLRRVPLSTA